MDANGIAEAIRGRPEVGISGLDADELRERAERVDPRLPLVALPFADDVGVAGRPTPAAGCAYTPDRNAPM